MAWRDRIKEFKRVPVGKLRANPKNPAIHGDDQREAMRGVLAEIGFIDAAIAREAEDGFYDLIDGHMRADLSPDQEVPVLIVELTDSEADAALATHDAIGLAVEIDQAKRVELLADIDALNEDFQRFIFNERVDAADALGDEGDEGDEEVTLRPMTTQKPPVMSWVLIGIPTVRFGEIAERVTELATIDGVLLETTVSDEPKPKNRQRKSRSKAATP